MASFPWTSSYPDGLRWDSALTPASIPALLRHAVERWPACPAIEFMGRTIPYEELGALVDRAACGLQQLGVKPGVKVGLYLPNTPQFVIAFFAVLKAGGTVVCYSPLDVEATLAHKIADSNTTIMITLNLASLYPKMQGLLQRSGLQTLVVGALGEFSAGPEAVAARLAQDGTSCAVDDSAQHIPFSRLLDNDGACAPIAESELVPALALLQYTGGTTGQPKGAMLSHANLYAAASQAALTATRGGGATLQEGSERVLVVLPLFHIYAIVVDLLLAVKIGAEMLLRARFDPAAVLHDVSTRRVTCLPGVPTMFTALISHPQAGELDLRSLKVCISGGAPLPVELQLRFEQMTGCGLSEGWGMTETTAIGTFTPGHDRRRNGSCGLPSPQVQIRLADLDDPEREVAQGERGEIVVRGPAVMQAYWNAPQANLDSFTADGGFRTGDVGYQDADGYIYIVDRCKDMLLCGGYNVYPRIIEEAIHTHPSVEETIVIGVADTYRGQSPKAYIKLRAGAAPLQLEELQQHLREHLGKHEMVQAIELRDALPKTAVGKLSRKMLMDELAAGA
ncbi:MAG: AMP-binding protein [Pseudomonadota bacterium]